MPFFKPVILWTDVVMWILVAALTAYVVRVRRDPVLSSTWRRVFQNGAAMASFVVLSIMLLTTMVDSLHFRRALPSVAGGVPAYDTRTESVLDLILAKLIAIREKSYSEPLAVHGFVKETVPPKAGVKPLLDESGAPALPRREFPRLKFGGASLQDPDQDWAADVGQRVGLGLLAGLVLVAALRVAMSGALQRQATAEWTVHWRAVWWVGSVLVTLVSVAVALSWGQGYHLLGTDRTGNDVLYTALKSMRTAFVIGSLATIATLPLALLLGIAAGYFKGWVDDLTQYVYTVLSSVPNILLIAACVLMVQVYLDKHPELFETGLERADLKIFLLCVILGVTGWAGLCRLLRAETLKLRELEYVQAATAFGVGPWRIMSKHILPNVMHLVLITTVLEFSSLILYEAILSYVGIGVDPSMSSFGAMINQARSEMSRDPVVWWSFAAAFLFMVTLVLAANLFADAVRDAFDPRAKVSRPKKMSTAKALTSN